MDRYLPVVEMFELVKTGVRTMEKALCARKVDREAARSCYHGRDNETAAETTGEGFSDLFRVINCFAWSLSAGILVTILLRRISVVAFGCLFR